MRKKRARWIYKQVINQNPNLLLALRNKLGEKTQRMNISQLYKRAKKLWYEVGKQKNWGIS